MSRLVIVTVDEEEVRAIALSLSKEQWTWDDYVWFFAEAELRLRPALLDGTLYAHGVESRHVEIDPSMIYDHPLPHEIRELAEDISHLGPSLQDLHWFIAERRYIYEKAKQSLM